MSTLASALSLLTDKKIAVLTGAGLSTDSGIPDYRGDGAPQRSPMTIDQFLGGAEQRQRYWAGSHIGWRKFADTQPNAGHVALAQLENAGIVTGVITQNVDGLHRQAGSRRVVEIHGAMTSVKCLRCGQVFSREDISARLTKQSHGLDVPDNIELAPDGDVNIDRLATFTVPTCENCEGILKPDVVYFGELIPRDRFRRAAATVRASGALLIAGSSLVVNSGIRLLDQAVRNDIPVVIVNRGATKGDSRATIRLEGGTTEVLTDLADALIG